MFKDEYVLVSLRFPLCICHGVVAAGKHQQLGAIRAERGADRLARYVIGEVGQTWIQWL